VRALLRHHHCFKDHWHVAPLLSGCATQHQLAAQQRGWILSSWWLQSRQLTPARGLSQERDLRYLLACVCSPSLSC
jgi:hypothetical protein